MKILITHTLMIKERHEQKLKDKGFDIVRLPDLEASEDQLCKAVADVDGYILGGLEKVTEPVVDAAKKLRAICTTAASWEYFIPAHEYATKRGIAIVSAQGANSQSVAELAVSLIHERARNLSYLSNEGQGQSITARNFHSMNLGLIGVGKIGKKVGRILYAAYGLRILYTSLHQNLDFEFATGATWVGLDELLRESDIINISVPDDDALVNLINNSNISLIKDGAIIVNTSFLEVIDPLALKKELEAGRISVGLDVGYQSEFSDISSRYLIQLSNYAGYNTSDASEIASNVVTQSIINLLFEGNDPWVVNPDFSKYR